jgi:acyl carrier protein
MKDKTKLIIAQVLNIPVESIQDDASTKTIENWDSLNHMNIIFAIEEQLQIRFDDDEIMKLDSVEKIITSLEKHLNQN